MANSESTAVNELIELASLKPLDGSDDAGLFAPARGASRDSVRSTQPVPTIRAVVPLSPGRAASGTKTNLKPAAEIPAPADVGSGKVSRPSRLTTIAPVRTEDSAPLVVSASDPWSLEPAAVEPMTSEADDPVGPIAWEPAEPNVVVTPSVALPLPKLPPLPPATRASVAIGTPAPELFSRSGARATLPPPVRMRAPTGSITVDPRGPTAAIAVPVAPPPIPSASVTLLGQMAQPVAAPAPKLLPPVQPMLHLDASEDDRPTDYFDRDELTPEPAITRNKLIIPMIAVGVAGALLGTILALRGGSSTSGAAVTPTAPVEAPKPVEPPTAVAAIPAPTAESAPAAIPAPAAVPAPEVATTVTAPPAEVAGPILVDVRFDSQPDGATVMIVDRGKTSLLGTTPTLGSLDPSRTYDAIFTTPGQPTRVEHFDPKQTHHLSIALDGKVAPAHVAPPAIAQATAPRHEEAAPRPVAPKHTAPEVTAPKHVAAEAPAAKHTAPPTAAAPKKVAVLDPKTSKTNGLLMISSKPPCSIFIDGKATGLVTPQRGISLAAGGHNVTLVNAKEKIKKTIAVEITASKSTKLIQDLMKK